MMDTGTDKPAESRVRELEHIIHELQLKIARLQRERGIYATRSRMYADQAEKANRREVAQENLVAELVERQHELNIMLNRSNVLLARAHEATAMLSAEFSELARALPEPDSLSVGAPAAAQIEDRVQRINNLFRKTGSLSEEIAETLSKNTTLEDRPPADASPAPPEEELTAVKRVEAEVQDEQAAPVGRAQSQKPPPQSNASASDSGKRATTGEPGETPVDLSHTSEQDLNAATQPTQPAGQSQPAEQVQPAEEQQPQNSSPEARDGRKELFSRPRATPAPPVHQQGAPTSGVSGEVLDAVIVEMDQSGTHEGDSQPSFLSRIRDMLFP